MVSKRALQEYQNVTHQGTVPEASPYKLIQMLMEGFLGRLHSAKVHLKKGDVVIKGNQISMAISILDCLQNSLDFEKGGQIAQNLNDLYEYMMQRLIEANMKDDSHAIDEVIALMKQIKEGWEGINPGEQTPSKEPNNHG